MLKLVKPLLVIAYGILFIQYLKLSFTERFIERVDIEYAIHKPGLRKKMIRDLRNKLFNITPNFMKYDMPIRLPTDYKYILKWSNTYLHYSSSMDKNGQDAFRDNNCKYNNCYLTNDKSLLLDVRNFDAILFDLENIWDIQPLHRHPRQKYIFTASESASDNPVCHPMFDSYYNLTWTYKLDSDITWTYISIFDKSNNLVGPKLNLSWIDPILPTPEKITKKFISKTKAAAWFVSNCNTRSGRYNLTKHLQQALKRYDLKIEIFGWCGKLTCPKERLEDCLSLLETDYYFYLSFESSLSEDFVTEKILYPLNHYAVPIVYGAVDYSRFLPPHSYIDAGKLSVEQVAELMYKAVNNPEVYQNYFRWHNYYEYRNSFSDANVCDLCRILNEEGEKLTTTTNFRKWWYSNYETSCKDFAKYMAILPSELKFNDVS